MKTIKFKYYHFFVWGFGYFAGYYMILPYNSYILGLMAAFSALFIGVYFSEKIHDITSIFLLGIFGGALSGMPFPVGPIIALILSIEIFLILGKLMRGKTPSIKSSFVTIVFENPHEKL